MRQLKFIVNGQKIEKVPSCDFSGLVAGTKGYLRAVFSFSSEWRGCYIAGVFRCMSKEYASPVIGNMCEIPAEALIHNNFYVRVVGQKDDFRITTNEIRVMQEGE